MWCPVLGMEWIIGGCQPTGETLETLQGDMNPCRTNSKSQGGGGKTMRAKKPPEMWVPHLVANTSASPVKARPLLYVIAR
jgi:hypothetical protein